MPLEAARPEPVTFEEVYRQHADDVYRFCLFLLRDPVVAEDVAADVFVAAFQIYRQSPPAAEMVRPWLFRIARNDVIDYRRRQRTWLRAMTRLRSGNHLSGHDVESIASLRMDVRDVLASLSRLSERDQLLVSLRCGADLSFEEIGPITGMTAAAASRATYRAMEKLRDRRPPARELGGALDG